MTVPRWTDPSEILQAADGMAPAELDALPYDMIQLDPYGRILRFNAVEARLSSLPQGQQIGKHFFTEVAPCTRVQRFYGRFLEGIRHEALDSTFTFHFAFKQDPRDVTIRLFYSRGTGTVWVLVRDQGGGEEQG